MTVSFPGSTDPLGTRSESFFNQKRSMVPLLPLMICSFGRGG